MHSRIFQLSTKPIRAEDYFSEADFYESWFINSIADYVSDDTNRDDDIAWLQTRTGLKVDPDADTLVIDDRQAYFSDQYNTWKQGLADLSLATLEQFIGNNMGFDDIGFEMYKLKMAYEEKYGFYVALDGSLMTMDEFVRLYPDGTTVYIGGTLDYHC